MHVRIQGTEGQVSVKWRGTALGEFDGQRWYNTASAGALLPSSGGVVRLADSRQLWRAGRRLSYEVFLRSSTSDMMFFTGLPEVVQVSGHSIIRTPTGSYRAAYGGENLRYAAVSFIEPGRPSLPVGDLLPNDRIYYTLLPPVDQRVLNLARDLTANKSTDEARAGAVEQYFHREFGYTTQMLAQPVADPLADFLFVRRKGHCEYFAGSMATLLRAVHIPARVVTGFQSGVYNPVSGWHIIRAADAHSWVEAYIAGRGWVTFDPTPPGDGAAPQSLWTKLLFYSDAAETFWQEWVLNYDLDRPARARRADGRIRPEPASELAGRRRPALVEMARANPGSRAKVGPARHRHRPTRAGAPASGSGNVALVEDQAPRVERAPRRCTGQRRNAAVSAHVRNSAGPRF